MYPTHYRLAVNFVPSWQITCRNNNNRSASQKLHCCKTSLSQITRFLFSNFSGLAVISHYLSRLGNIILLSHLTLKKSCKNKESHPCYLNKIHHHKLNFFFLSKYLTQFLIKKCYRVMDANF